ncbi:MAG: MBOAT family O-acyltransferase [Nitrospirota bacterium]
MLFTSEIFIFLFLPLVIICNFVLSEKHRNFLLLLASLFFYAWGEPVFVFLMIASITINYFFGILLEKDGNKKILLGLSVSFNLALLIFFKYTNFIVENINNLLIFYGINKIEFYYVKLPIGISFFTFHILSYIIDVYRKDVSAQKNPLDLGLYISFFPQLIAGPIVRYHDIAHQLKHRFITNEKVIYGIKRFIIGFAKKIVIANSMGHIADKIFALEASNITCSVSWIGAICYSLQIYYDFSGYSEMAIGLARIFGFHFLENFNYPYFSQSIKEFWRRWHISLSSWFRDYLYIPIGGSRNGKGKTYRNLLIVFLLCGLWHGSSWNFIIWGLFHGFFLVLERTRFGIFIGNMWQPFRHIYALFVVITGWVFFRADNLTHALNYLKNMFGMGHATSSLKVSMFLTNETPIILIIALIGMIPVIPNLAKALYRYSQKESFFYVEASLHLTIFFISITWLINSSYNPFIYFRF